MAEAKALKTAVRDPNATFTKRKFDNQLGAIRIFHRRTPSLAL
jgi:hypothetical protein